MKSTDVIQILIFVLTLIICAYPLGLWMAKILSSDKKPSKIESVFYRLYGIDPLKEMNWKDYSISLILFHKTLLNSISHEMRTPLTTIMGIANRLDQKTTDNADDKSIAHHLIESSNRLNRVIKNLLDMSRLNAGSIGIKLEWNDVDLLFIDYRLFEHVFESGHLRVDINLKKVEVSGQEIKLTKTEFELLLRLIRDAEKVVPQNKLMKEIWGSFAQEETHYLRIYIKQLRKKLRITHLHLFILLQSQA